MSWWEAYFGELYLRLFETMQASDSTAQEVAGVLGMLDLGPGARILDLGCGQGRHAVPLARLGYQVTGLDRSSYLLSRAQQAGHRAGADVRWVRGDLRALPWQQQFDVCLNLLTTFGYFEDEDDNERVLHEGCRVLRPGGRFFLDVANRDHCLLHLWPSSWRRHGAAIILEKTRFDATRCRFTTTFTWLEGGQMESLTHSVRHYTAPELVAMMQRAGLTPIILAGDFDGSPFDVGSKRLIVVAEKR